jgi:hypothetical protein
VRENRGMRGSSHRCRCTNRSAGGDEGGEGACGRKVMSKSSSEEGEELAQ